MDSTTTICDSVATCVNKTAEICQHCVKEVTTSWQDVVMTGLEYAFILCLAYLLLNSFLKWWTQRFLTKTKRNHEMEDRKLKQKADLQDKLLSFQKDCAEIKRDDHGNICPKYKYEDSAYKDYKNTLVKLINEEKLESNDKEAQIPPVEIR